MPSTKHEENINAIKKMAEEFKNEYKYTLEEEKPSGNDSENGEKKKGRTECRAEDLHGKKILELSERNADLIDTLKRLQAEFENYQKRTEKEKQLIREYAAADVIERLLPVIDAIELAKKNAGNEASYKQGIELIFRQLADILKAMGLMPIEAKGKPFSHEEHEVMLRDPSSEKEDTVLEELQKGYRFNERIIRHAKVKVAAPMEQEKENGTRDGQRNTTQS